MPPAVLYSTSATALSVNAPAGASGGLWIAQVYVQRNDAVFSGMPAGWRVDDRWSIRQGTHETWSKPVAPGEVGTTPAVAVSHDGSATHMGLVVHMEPGLLLTNHATGGHLNGTPAHAESGATNVTSLTVGPFATVSADALLLAAITPTNGSTPAGVILSDEAWEHMGPPIHVNTRMVAARRTVGAPGSFTVKAEWGPSARTAIGYIVGYRFAAVDAAPTFSAGPDPAVVQQGTEVVINATVTPGLGTGGPPVSTLWEQRSGGRIVGFDPASVTQRFLTPTTAILLANTLATDDTPLPQPLTITRSAQGGDPFDLLTVVTGSTAQFVAEGGGSVLELASSGSANTTAAGRHANRHLELHGAVDMFLPSLPAFLTVHRATNGGSLTSTRTASVSMATDRSLRVGGDASTSGASSAAGVVPLGAWFRLEWRYKAGAGTAGQAEARLWLDPDSDGAADVTVLATGITVTEWTALWLGITNGVTGQTMRLANYRTGTTWLGPASAAARQAGDPEIITLRGMATGAGGLASSWDTVVVTAERPTTGWADLSLPAVLDRDARFVRIVVEAVDAEAGDEYVVDEVLFSAGSPDGWAPPFDFIHYQVDFSYDAGVTVDSSRLVESAAGIGQADFFDFTSRPQSTVWIRVRPVGSRDGVLLAGPPSEWVGVDIRPETWWWKVPDAEHLNTAVEVRNEWSMRIPIAGEKEYPLPTEGLIDAKAVSGVAAVYGREGVLPLRTRSKADYERVWSIIRSGRRTLLQSMHGEQWWAVVDPAQVSERLIRVAPSETEEDQGMTLGHFHELDVPIHEVEPPAPS